MNRFDNYLIGVSEANCVLVSIIIPVYNVETHIQRTLNSAASQSYSNIEVIMVDDGSTDNSAGICKSMAARDNRFKYLHKDNGGLSSSRNYGMKAVRGEYITFLDGDDVLAPFAVEYMLSIALNNAVDLVSCAYKKIAEGEEFNGCVTADVRLVTAEQHLEMLLLLENETGSACAKIIGKRLYKTLLFPEGQLFEDFGVVAKLIEDAGKTVVSDAQIYGYVTRFGSITGKKVYGSEHFDGMLASLETVKSAIANFAGLGCSFECFEAFCLVRVASKLSKELSPDADYYKSCIRRAKKAAKKALKNSKVRIAWKMRCALFAISRTAYNVLYWIYGKATGKVVG